LGAAIDLSPGLSLGSVWMGQKILLHVLLWGKCLSLSHSKNQCSVHRPQIRKPLALSHTTIRRSFIWKRFGDDLCRIAIEKVKKCVASWVADGNGRASDEASWCFSHPAYSVPLGSHKNTPTSTRLGASIDRQP
jgi:hypothetical protein